MKTKEQKIAQVDELIERLGVSREDVIKHWLSTSMANISSIMLSAIEAFNKTDYTNIKPWMLWYKGDIFLFERIEGKEVKAIVELVEDGVIYGDLTASELFDIPERHMP